MSLSFKNEIELYSSLNGKCCEKGWHSSNREIIYNHYIFKLYISMFNLFFHVTKLVFKKSLNWWGGGITEQSVSKVGVLKGGLIAKPILPCHS